MTKKTYQVPDVSCGHCKASIESALGAMGGIETVDVEVDQKTVDVAFDESTITEEQIKAALAEEGYPVAA
ncbi:MAG TPA: copper ion binding protein [Thermoleophilia bacterium]|nr:copper ion binding protein [Thermoleophilia bacterium]